MKNQITLNIGLASGTGPCAPHLILADLRAHGFIVSQSRIAQGVWNGKPEATLVVVCSYVIPLQFKESRLIIGHALCEIARKHNQECAAIAWPDGTGDLFPACNYSFDPSQFHFWELKDKPSTGKVEISCGW